MASAAARQVVVGLAGADHRPLDVPERLPPPDPLEHPAGGLPPPRRRRGTPPAPPSPATGRSSLPNRQDRMQSQPTSSAGSPTWHSSQSITAASPSSSTMKLPSRKSPWTRRRRRPARGRLPAASAGRPRRRAAARRSGRAPAPRARMLARAGSPPGARAPPSRSPRSIEWIRASASASWPGQPLAYPWRARRDRAPAARRTPRRRRPSASGGPEPPARAARAAAARRPGRPPRPARGRQPELGRLGSERLRPGRVAPRATHRCSPGLRQAGLARGAAWDPVTAAPGIGSPSSASASRAPALSGLSSVSPHPTRLSAVALPVAVGDVGRVLVPVPGAGIVVEVLGRVGRVDRVADPADRQRLVHERAVGAVEREALAPVAPVVGLVGDPPPVLAVAARCATAAGPSRRGSS